MSWRVLPFDPELHLSPFALFRILATCRERSEEPPLLIDLRPAPGPLRLAGAAPVPDPAWTPPSDRDVVVVDDDGAAALDLVRRWRKEGHTRVRALYGGLTLYDFALDPAVVGKERSLQ